MHIVALLPVWSSGLIPATNTPSGVAQANEHVVCSCKSSADRDKRLVKVYINAGVPPTCSRGPEAVTQDRNRDSLSFISPQLSRPRVALC